MSCGCQGETTPKVSGTEVTILSGTTPARRNPEAAESGNGVYYVAGGALLVAIIAFITTRK